ncbi:MAG: LacI family transcriptional regulator [Bacteroidales bacterium]|nr:LacI family transcriptional regulator [Bacteroidales bacterium]
MKTHSTIIDIVRLTGLSRGTVDRVLHNRGEVSRASREKVMQAIEQLGYEPNAYASLLASKKSFVLAVLIPESREGSFWEVSERGIAMAAKSIGGLGVEVLRIGYRQYDSSSFREACRTLLDANPDGVVVAPLHREETARLAEELAGRSIPYIYVDTKIEEDRYLAYFGMPMVKSGHLCAYLLSQDEKVPSVLVIRLRADKENRYDPNVSRREGFMEFMLENNPDCSIHTLFLDPGHPEDIGPALERFHADHPEVRHVVTFNSRIYLIVPFLEKCGPGKMRVIGYDNLDANVEALRRGTISTLIAQHPEEQVRMALLTLADYVALKKAPATRDHLMHMDILTRYNVEDY